MLTRSSSLTISVSPAPTPSAITLAVDLTKVNVGQPGTFTGSVKDQYGNGVPNQFLEIIDQTGKILTTGFTDANGNFSISVTWASQGTFTLYAQTYNQQTGQPLGPKSGTIMVTVAIGVLSGQQAWGTIIGPQPAGVTPQYNVALGVSVYGGVLPFQFSMVWNDGYVDTSGATTGVFNRPWNSYPTSLAGTLTVKSADGQAISIPVRVPFP